MLLYWYGYSGNKSLVDELRPLFEELDCKLITISDKDCDVIWNNDTWLEELKKADVIVIPCNYQLQSCKSNNRLTQAMSLGKPCIVSPLPAYIKIIDKYPVCALVAATKDDWKRHIEYLKNLENRQKISKIALEASKEYSIDVIAKKWLEQFKDLEKIDIIIPVYNNHVYLKFCLESIRKNTTKLFNIIISDSGSDQETWDFYKTLNDVTVLGKQTLRLNFAQSCNDAIKHTKSKYFVILNSDVIVSKNWEINLLDKMKMQQDLAACGVLSNCDRFWLHHAIDKPTYNMNLDDLELIPEMKLSQLEGKINRLYSFMDESNKLHSRTFVNQEWVAYYATMFNRELIEKVGLLDTNFNNDREDLDHCIRIKKMGFKIGQSIGSFVFHFGGISKYQSEDKESGAYFKEKWDKKSIIIFSGASWEKWDYRNIEKGIGGSETWVILLAREFDKLGYKVTVFNDCQQDCNDGNIKYIHFSKLSEHLEYNCFDYFISSRTEEPFSLNIKANKKIVILHDICLLSGKDVQYNDKIDKFLVLSDWHKQYASDWHNIPKEKIVLTSNGIDLTRFSKNIERHPSRLIYSSSLDRGLDTLLYLFDFIKMNVPDLELHIFYGFDTWEKMAKTPEQKEKIDNLKKLMDKPGVFFHGRVGQQQLAEEMLKSTLLLYPTTFEETFCITAIEAQAAGLPVIATNYAGLQTTIADSGILIGNGDKYQALTKDCRIQFVEKCVELLKVKQVWNEWSQKSLKNAQKYSWENVAKQLISTL